MIEFLRLTSALGIILTGIVVLILWILAANDKGTEGDGLYGCKGCNRIVHDALRDDYYVNTPAYGFSSSLNTWAKNNRDAFSVLVAFGVILGVFWMITGAIGFIARTEFMAKLYFIMGIITYLIFDIMFPIIVEKITWVNAHCAGPNSVCRKDRDWVEKRGYDSYEWFWGSSLVAFIMGAYQIASAAYIWARHIPELPKPVGDMAT
jgi:hypothetical protein